MTLEPDFRTGALTLYHGDAYAVMAELPERSVHCLVTSPPYWGLRRYSGHEGEQVRLFEDGWTGQYGSEPTPQMWAEHTAEWLRVARRVLRDDATAWVNLGDAYSGANSRGGTTETASAKQLSNRGTAILMGEGRGVVPAGFKPLDLIWQAALLYPLLLRDGWYVRSVVIWAKPAPMPESVSGWEWRRCRVKVKGQIDYQGQHYTPESGLRGHGADIVNRSRGVGVAEYADCPGCPKCAPTGGWVLRRGSWRPTSSHEYILMLAKSERYFCDQEAVREECSPATIADGRTQRGARGTKNQYALIDGNAGYDPAGRNPRSVWRIGPEPTKEHHYAAYPSELPERCIKVATSEHGVCAACGAPWARMIEKPFYGTWHDHDAVGEQFGKWQNGKGPSTDYEKPKTVGWRKTCGCQTEERVSATVIDPFFGTGSTGRAVLRLGRRCIGIDIAQDYTEIAVKYLRQDLLV